MSWMEYLALTGSAVLFIVGIAGVFLPVIPGVILVFAGVLLFAIVEGFERFSPVILILLGSLAVAVSVLDNLAGIYGARKFGATSWGLWGAVIGLVAGLFFGPLGIILGPLAGALFGEIIGGQETARAAKAGIGTLVGFLGGVFVKLLISLIIIIVFIYTLSCG